MGFQMAGNIRKNMSPSSTLHIYDVSEAACQRFISTFQNLGSVEMAKCPREVAQKSKTMVSMVPADRNVRIVYLDTSNGVIAASRDQDRLLLDCSTIEARTAQEIGKEMRGAGAGLFIDTPVSGGVSGAEARTLAFLCGYQGFPQSDPVAKRVFDTVCLMGLPERVVFCGQLGAGLVSKIVNNYIALCNTLALAEGMALGIKHGVDKRILYKCIQASSGRSWVSENAVPVPGIIPLSSSSNGFKMSFASQMCVKDISLAIKAAQEVAIDLSVGEIAMKIYQKAAEDPRTSVSIPISISFHPRKSD
jgi:3-hydroxyisobutyrate dehydrogenase-like beta-hydroxyacid dehydrogenase